MPVNPRRILSAAKRSAMSALPDPAAALMRSFRPVVGDQLRSTKQNVAEARKGVGEYRRMRAFMRAVESPVDDSLVVWESFGGNGALCSPAALFREVIDAPDLAHLSHVWMLRKDVIDAGEGLAREFAGHPRVRFVEYRSAEYFGLLQTAGRLINNATFPHEFVKRTGQLYLNTWHGTPLKHMGYDEPDGAWASRNVLRNFLSADYLLSSGPYMTDHMYRGAYRLEPLFKGEVVEDGFPRVDAQFTAGRSPNAARTLLYAPTWRGASFRDAAVEVAALADTVAALRDLPALAGWTIQLKVHQSVYRQVKNDPRLADSLVPDSIPANELLAHTDLLLTDFSSIFIDALATDIPVVFFAHDFDEYLADRGTYLPPAELPGPVARTIPDLREAVTQLLEGPADADLASRYAGARARWVSHEDGKAAARLADLLFRGRPSPDVRRVRLDDDQAKTSVVINLGGLKPNGISTSALNLLSQLDRDRYDVTAVFPVSHQPERVAVRAQIPHDIRVLPVHGGLTRLPLAASYTRMLDAAIDLPRTGPLPDDPLWRLEWRRIVGDAAFDVAIDFSGYSAKWVRLMAHTGAQTSLVWMHNDLAADSERVVDGKRPYQRTLRTVFGMLSRYDHLVSVSAPLRDINRDNLGQFAPSEAFTFARNAIDPQRILAGAGRVPGEQDLVRPRAGESDLSAQADPGAGLDDIVDALLRAYGSEAVHAAVEDRTIRSLIRERRGAGPVFTTVGRMSPEKNHDRLLRAFAQVVDTEPEALLVLVGDGPLRAQLEATAAELGVGASVVFTGQIPHPYAVLDESDCFVLSSDYEGQPMVILEALVLDLPVITTAFGSAQASLPEGIGRIVDRDVDALAEAMRTWQTVPHGGFDPSDYNRTVLDEFAAAVDPGGVSRDEPCSR